MTDTDTSRPAEAGPAESGPDAPDIPCRWRLPTHQRGWYECRHGLVHVEGGVVTRPVCMACTVRTLPNPRPQGCCGAAAMATVPPVRKPPSLPRQGWNLVQSLAAFVADGARTVDADRYRARLEICDTCDRREGAKCLECGCVLSIKARGRAFKCPLDKWPKAT